MTHGSNGGTSLREVRVLITGGLGFIGSNLAYRAVAEGATVRLLDSSLVGSGGNPANIADIRERVEFVRGDVRNPEDVRSAVQDIDLVFHAAAQTSHTRSMQDALLSLDVNGRGTLQLLEAVRLSRGGAKVVHVGTTTQFGPMVREPVDERHPEFPRDIYSATMVGSEKVVLVYAHAQGIRATVVRLPNTYGPRAAIRSADLGFVNYFIGLALQGKDLTVYGDGGQGRSLLYVDDAVDALVRAGQSPKADGEVFLATSPATLSVGDIAAAVVKNIGGRVVRVPWPEERRRIEVGNMTFDCSKIASALSWAPRVDVATGLAQTRAYYSHRLGDYLEVAR